MQGTYYIDPTVFLKPLVQYLKPGAEIIDVGCGSGRDLRWLKKKDSKRPGSKGRTN